MDGHFPGLGTLINIATIVVGALLGMAAGHRLPERVRRVVTDALGLVTIMVAALSAAVVAAPELTGAVPSGAPVLIVLGSLLIGGIVGAGLRLDERLGELGGRVHAWTARRWPGRGTDGRERFVEGWLAASLLFCVGPLTILGSLSDGLGLGIEQLLLKSVLDGFAALAFASTFGVGVLFSVVTVAVVQGSFTVAGVLLGAVLPDAHVAALTATGGLVLAGIGLRLLRIRDDLAVASLLPALVVAPLLTHLVIVVW